LIEHLDDNLAPLLAAFRARSEKAGHPWAVVVTSDHGYFRKCEPYEGAANIPLIFAGSPELGWQTGTRCDQPVCLEDILPTLLAVAGSAVPPGLDGVNLLPTLRGRDQRIREALHFEHAPCYSTAQAFHALTDGRFKYIWRPADGSEQLFDLVQDPDERHDLARLDTERDRTQQWRTRLIQRLKHRPEGFTDGTRLVPGRPYPPIINSPRPPSALP
jgi:arylsulfatase A-like enzyme